MTLQQMKNIQDLVNLAQERGIFVKYQVVDLDEDYLIDEDYNFDRIEESYCEALFQAMEDYDIDEEKASRDYVGLMVIFCL